MKDDLQTLKIDNFQGQMTNFRFGDINSGRSYIQIVSGQNPYIKPGSLTWNNAPVQIDPNASVITDMIVAGKERMENSIIYMYAIGHTGRLYKIQVNNPSTKNPDYDNPVLLATITTNSPKFTMGGFIEFFGSTSAIYIGHDKGVTKINFDGSSETFVGVLASWTQNVPRPLKIFLGKLYAGNGNNLAEITDPSTVTTYTKLSPGFPSNTQTRNLELTPDGNYLQAIVTEAFMVDITQTANPFTDRSVSSNSYIFKWNGTDNGATSSNAFPSFSLTASKTFGNYQYTFGYDSFGSAIYNPLEKIITDTEGISPMPNAITSSGSTLLIMQPIFYGGVLEADIFAWGFLDFEVGNPLGYWDLGFINASGTETDVNLVPFFTTVSNSGIGSSSNGYSNNIFTNCKFYFSTLETSSTTTKYKFYKWDITNSLRIPSSTPLQGVYETQTQMFSKKIQIKEIRIYGEPWVANNEFQIDLIGSIDNPISGGTKTFTAGSELTIGGDMALWNPQITPTYALGIRITNLGSANHTINKIEIDYSSGGK